MKFFEKLFGILMALCILIMTWILYPVIIAVGIPCLFIFYIADAIKKNK